MFDLNGDGKIDPSEEALEFMYFDEIMKEQNKEEKTYGPEQLEDIEMVTGYSKLDLDFMDEDERNEILEDAGIDPDFYEEDF
ncbi:MAG: hypothetical protein K6A23_13285 [Butyrivibrio sp.]|nr:hypothetical protein [Butyrivibrio sp.]